MNVETATPSESDDKAENGECWAPLVNELRAHPLLVRLRTPPRDSTHHSYNARERDSALTALCRRGIGVLCPLEARADAVLAELAARARALGSLAPELVCAEPLTTEPTLDPAVLRPLWDRALEVERRALDLMISSGCTSRQCEADWRLADAIVLLDDEARFCTEQCLRRPDALRVLVDTVYLVHYYRLEERPERWPAAHAAYLRRGFVGSALLVRRRWHELKLATRRSIKRAARWKGIEDPPPLHIAVARRFPQVLSHIPSWRELRASGALSQEDGASAELSGFSDDPSWLPAYDEEIDEDDDLILIEREIETVDLLDDDELLRDSERNKTVAALHADLEKQLREFAASGDRSPSLTENETDVLPDRKPMIGDIHLEVRDEILEAHTPTRDESSLKVQKHTGDEFPEVQNGKGDVSPEILKRSGDELAEAQKGAGKETPEKRERAEDMSIQAVPEHEKIRTTNAASEIDPKLLMETRVVLVRLKDGAGRARRVRLPERGAGAGAGEPGVPTAQVAPRQDAEGARLAALVARLSRGLRGALGPLAALHDRRQAAHCCIARKHRAVNDARRRAASHARRPPPPEINLHKTHCPGLSIGAPCECCCAALLQVDALAAQLEAARARLRGRVRALFGCTHPDDDEVDGPLLKERKSLGGSSAAVRNKRPTSSKRSADAADKKSSALLQKREKKSKKSAKAKRKKCETVVETQVSEKEPQKVGEDDAMNEWIRQKNITSRFFDLNLKAAPGHRRVSFELSSSVTINPRPAPIEQPVFSAPSLSPASIHQVPPLVIAPGPAPIDRPPPSAPVPRPAAPPPPPPLVPIAFAPYLRRIVHGSRPVASAPPSDPLASVPPSDPLAPCTPAEDDPSLVTVAVLPTITSVPADQNMLSPIMPRTTALSVTPMRTSVSMAPSQVPNVKFITVSIMPSVTSAGVAPGPSAAAATSTVTANGLATTTTAASRPRVSPGQRLMPTANQRSLLKTTVPAWTPKILSVESLQANESLTSSSGIFKVARIPIAEPIKAKSSVEDSSEVIDLCEEQPRPPPRAPPLHRAALTAVLRAESASEDAAADKFNMWEQETTVAAWAEGRGGGAARVLCADRGRAPLVLAGGYAVVCEGPLPLGRPALLAPPPHLAVLRDAPSPAALVCAALEQRPARAMFWRVREEPALQARLQFVVRNVADVRAALHSGLPLRAVHVKSGVTQLLRVSPGGACACAFPLAATELARLLAQRPSPLRSSAHAPVIELSSDDEEPIVVAI